MGTRVKGVILHLSHSSIAFALHPVCKRPVARPLWNVAAMSPGCSQPWPYYPPLQNLASGALFVPPHSTRFKALGG
ncbi:hypothetical protein BU16DRAFT_526806 [Lophium mytilinum]|uniref:Uncharacterized protein n=1 Tax=Lophium mytilinum TaxID=390894 RepID=A0A6A6QV55_9PEZI|nr:hypothetical protein BU16DRAFT_526806 [Lophium mytilinum]